MTVQTLQIKICQNLSENSFVSQYVLFSRVFFIELFVFKILNQYPLVCVLH